jgi:MFS family permease
MGFLDRENTIADSSYSRWQFPTAAIAVQMCIGEIYGFNVFNVPLTKLVGLKEPLKGTDWTIPEVGWFYSLGLIILGLSAAVLGKWVERSGPRKTMVASMACFCGGLLIASFGVYIHNYWLTLFGYGFVGGIGLGLGYIAPVSTLLKWFPDRPGMATGFAIMGFGSGALVGGPLGQMLMEYFKTPASMGVWQSFIVMAALYSVMMCFGAFTAKVPPTGWKPEGWTPPPQSANLMITQSHVSADEAIKTPQFWLLWVVLCMNVSAGIGILGQSTLMLSDMFGQPAAVGAGLVGLLSIFNMVGRFFWSSTSDYTGRKGVYYIYFLLGLVLYLLIPYSQSTKNVILFVGVTCVIISMYGGGFATIPAYLRDMFGTYQVGAIHGRLITAWSAAAIIGPQVINYISTNQKAAGIPKELAYNKSLYICAGMLVVGLIANLLVRPVDAKHHYKGADLATGAPAPTPATTGVR